MHNPEIIEETPVTMSVVVEELKKIQKRDSELNFRANRTLDYLSQCELLAKKDAETLYESLTKLNIPRLKDIHIAKIVDMVPKNVEELKVLLQGYTLTVNSDNLKKIVDAIKKLHKNI